MLKSPSCNHWWAEILTPCSEGKNFSTCASFQNGKARSPQNHPIYKAEAKTCPKCDKKDDYDGEKIRMIKGVMNGYRCGTGPSKSDGGFEVQGHQARMTERSFEPPGFCRVFCTVM